MSAKRNFEFSEGTSNKFWEIWAEGTQVFTRYGKIGASGQTTVKDEGSEEKAQKLYDKLVREKTGKGYVEKGGGAAPAAPAPAPQKAKEPPKASAPEKKPAAPAPVAAPAPAPAAGGTRRFEFTEDGSSKFWEITVDGAAHTVRYGKIGTPGQEKSKSFGNAAAAQNDADKLIREKTGKGYAEVAGGGGGGDAGPPPPPLDAKELEKQLRALDEGADPAQACLVFADWLESKGHPWGKLIALQQAIAAASGSKKAELEREETAWLQSHGSAIVGTLSRAGRPTRFEWKHGFIEQAIIGSPTDKVVLEERLSTLFALPAARGLKRLTLHAQPARLASHQDWEDSTGEIVDPWAGAITALAQAPASLTELVFGEAPPSGASAYVAPPALAKVAKAMPKLQVLEVQGAGGGAEHGLDAKWGFPELTTLEVRLANPNAEDLSAIGTAKLPKLQSLSVWLGGQAHTDLDSAGYDPYDNEDGDARYPETYPASDLEKMEIYEVDSGVDTAALAALLARPFPASLKRLGINSALLDTAMVEAILASPILPKLEVLDLSGGTLRDEDAQLLAKKKNKLEHLKELNVARNRLSKTAFGELLKAVPSTKGSKQRESGDPEFIFRYVATME